MGIVNGMDIADQRGIFDENEKRALGGFLF